MKINVRCCCQPVKIFGTLEIDGPVQDGARVTLMKPVAGHSMCLHNVTQPSFSNVLIKRFVDPDHGTEELAIYSEERPVEFWRGVKGFIEGDVA